MNRSILLIICDFLLLSLLALARFDAPEIEAENTDVTTKAVSQEEELIDILKMSLEAERDRQDELSEKLSSAEDVIEEKEKAIDEAQSTLAITQELFDQERVQKEEIIAQKELLQQEHGTLAEDILKLREQNILERERLRQAQLEIESKEKALAENQEVLDETKAAVEQLEAEKQEVMTELKVAETKNVLVAQQLENTKLEVEIERRQREEAEKRTESLSEGVKALAGTSVEIKEEIKQLQPITPNALFTEYKRNRVGIRFDVSYRGIFNNREKSYESQSILINDTRTTYAILHTRETPFDLTEVTPTYDFVNLTITIGDTIFHPEKVMFSKLDPRILLIPLDGIDPEQADPKVYPVVLEPFRFPQAVVINSNENYFGESDFKVHPNYSYALQMDRKILSKLFGEFSPSRGDLVFAQTGEFMGMMVNNEYAALMDHISTSDTIWLGETFDAERTNTILAKLSGLLYRRL